MADTTSLEAKIKKLDDDIEASEKSIESIDSTIYILDKGKLYKEHKKRVKKYININNFRKKH